MLPHHDLTMEALWVETVFVGMLSYVLTLESCAMNIGRSDAQQQAEQASSKEAVLQHMAKLAAMRKAAPAAGARFTNAGGSGGPVQSPPAMQNFAAAHAAQCSNAAGGGGPAQAPSAMETAAPSSAAAQPSTAGGNGGPFQSLPATSIPKASPPQLHNGFILLLP